MSRISVLAIAGAFALTVSAPALSKIFYVDSLNGNDAWSGESASPGANDGPWQSLSRISVASIMPGDSVLLKCGGVWYETLTLKASGTAANPITVGSYPYACTNKPLISGSTPIPAHNWVLDSGKIYKMSSAIDLITFGSFENGLGNWGKWSPQNNADMSLSTSCAQANSSCMSFTAGSGSSIVISNYFALQGKQAYTASFALKAPAGTSVSVVLRRAAPPWDAVGLTSSIAGTGNWQTLTLPFTATASVTNARLDFVVPANRNIGLDNVKITALLPAVLGVFDNGKTINVAHHPNLGHNPLRPDSLYFSIAENSSTVSLTSGGTGSSYLTTGSDLAALAHPAITAGTGIRVRPNAWTLNDRKIASVSGSRLTFDTPTTHPIEKDWGYFLYGQRWMLDEPGEWHYDATTKTVYVWMADSLAPGNRISLGHRAVGIEARDKNHIRIDGLAIQNVGVGVDMLRGNNVKLSNLAILDTLGLGIDALLSIDSGVENSQITRTATDAISARLSTRFNVYDNLITDSSVQTTNGTITSLPEPATAAITAGDSAIIRSNRIYGMAYAGIFALANNVVSENHIENACLVLDDCGAIYTSGSSPNITIENNTVLHVIGGLAGKPPINAASQAQGIYLDNLSTDVIVRGNTVADADNGIQIHNAANNRIEGNTLYGNRRHQLWLQEQTNRLHTEGDIYDNIVQGNRLFSTTVATLATTAIKQETKLQKGNTHRFASYDNNLYFTFLSPTISSETWPSGNASYILPTWQAAVTTDGLPRNLDPTASEVNSASLGYAAYRTTGTGILPNGNLAAGKTGWEFWNRTAPYGVITLESCTVASQCLRYTAGASVSQLSSPKFSVQKDKWYKVSFDFKTGTNAQQAYVVARRGGGGTNGYENLMSASIGIVGTTTWKRYGFIFQATKTVNVNDPVTLDKGARVDFDGVMPGQNITVANLELVPLSAIDASLRSHILINPGSSNLDVDCPDGTNSVLCGEYVRFSDGQSITWPYTVAPHASEVIYSRDSSLTDSDGDGIPDYQDKCAGTPPLKAVNAAGCTLGQP